MSSSKVQYQKGFAAVKSNNKINDSVHQEYHLSHINQFIITLLLYTLSAHLSVHPVVIDGFIILIMIATISNIQFHSTIKGQAGVETIYFYYVLASFSFLNQLGLKHLKSTLLGLKKNFRGVM